LKEQIFFLNIDPVCQDNYHLGKKFETSISHEYTMAGFKSEYLDMIQKKKKLDTQTNDFNDPLGVYK